MASYDEFHILVLAGGGSGGVAGTGTGGGGGGAGEMIDETSVSLDSATDYTITVGDGGARSTGGAANDGEDSSIGADFIAKGGGGGAGTDGRDGRDGGSGGGATRDGTPGAADGDNTNVGGDGFENGAGNRSAGGGGGAGGVGGAGSSGVGGDGGLRLSTSIKAVSASYGGGGGGGGFVGGDSPDGAGKGGDDGQNGTDGGTNLGSGGGGAGTSVGPGNGHGGAGGSGQVAIRFLTGSIIIVDKTGAVEQEIGGDTLLQWNESGSFRFSLGGYVISGVVTLQGEPVSGATMRCIKQSDNSIIASVMSGEDGEYAFEELEENELYHIAVEYEADSTLYNALSLWDVSPVLVEA